MPSRIQEQKPNSLRRRFLFAGGWLTLASALPGGGNQAFAASGDAKPPGLTPALAAELAALGHLSGAPVAPLEDRIVVVTFFASWCPPCRTEFKHLSAIHKRYAPADLRIVAINLFEQWGSKPNPARLRRFLKDTAPPFTVIRGNDRISEGFGNITRIPTLLVFDRRGRIAYRFIHHRGAEKTHATEAEIRRVVEMLL